MPPICYWISGICICSYIKSVWEDDKPHFAKYPLAQYTTVLEVEAVNSLEKYKQKSGISPKLWEILTLTTLISSWGVYVPDSIIAA